LSAAPPPCRSVTSRQTGDGRPPQFPRPHVADQVARQRRASAGTRQIRPFVSYSALCVTR
jgi:hypothetical protein